MYICEANVLLMFNIWLNTKDFRPIIFYLVNHVSTDLQTSDFVSTNSP